MIQITPQMHVLVAVEPVDLRKGIDGLAQLCREKLQADLFSGWLFVFRSRRATAIRILVYDGQGFWMVPVVAHGYHGGQDAAGASGATAAGSRQSGNRGGAGVAQGWVEKS